MSKLNVPVQGLQETVLADKAIEDLRKATDYLDKASDGLRRAGLDHYTIDCLYGLVRNEAQRLENAIR